jgi:oxygen-independent coproporphyrinogen-3 oxidase
MLETALKRKAAGEAPWRYFDHRVHSPREAKAQLPVTRLAPPQASEAFKRSLNASDASDRRVMYVHIPYCRQICRFCGYNRQVLPDLAAVEEYVQAVIHQIKCYSTTPSATIAPFEAIYIGGGTPTALPHDALTRIITTLREGLALTPDCEITVESRCDGVSQEDVRALLDAGVNRMSFGVQSFDTGVRRAMGRIADRERMRETLQAVEDAGLHDICIDLIYNLPQQTMATWQDDFAVLANTPIRGCSLYPLILFPNSELAGRIARHEEPPPGDLEKEYEFYTYADTMLGETMQWERFTPVQYGNKRVERAKYVTAHGQSQDVIGFGAGAGGRIGVMTYMNTPQIPDYVSAREHDSDAPVTVLMLPHQYREVSDWYQLSEGAGICGSEMFGQLPGIQAIIEQLTALDLLEKEGDEFRLTQAGRFWAGNISAILSELMRTTLMSHTEQGGTS